MADVTLPSLGESVTEGVITRWFKRVGDLVARDEPLFEISTDKVDSEMPSPAAGVLVQILADEGDTVETGARVAVIDESAQVAPAEPPSAPAPPSPAAPPSGGTATPVAPAAVAPARPPEPVAPAPGLEPATGGERAGLVTSPVVRRILADGGVDPASIHGSGPGGAITRRDAERAVANGPTDDQVVPLSHGLRRMGQHMALSAQTTPHGFVAIEIDGDVFVELERLGRHTRDGVPIADEMVVGLAAVRALGEFEFLNATFAGDELVVHRTVNLGFMREVHRDGMLVPVVHAAAGLTLRALARRVHELGERVDSRQLTTDDLMGGTFTLVGPTGARTLWTQPIIIQPQVAVLSMGAVRQSAIVRDDGGVPRVDVGARLVLGLSFDHRVCEPFTATAYLERVGELIAGLDLESER